MLDIRSFMNVHTNLAILLPMLLTKEQTVLFERHRARSILFDSESLKKKLKSKDEIAKQERRLHPLPTFEDVGQEKQREALKTLLGYRMTSRLDKKLFLGLLESDD